MTRWQIRLQKKEEVREAKEVKKAEKLLCK